MRWGWVLLFVLLGVTNFVSAATSPVQDWIARANQQHLATSAQWLSLVHYRPNLIRSGYTSFASGRSFFLAKNGRVDPQSELEATLQAIALPISGSPDAHAHAQCRFIARYHWLRQALAIPDDQLPHVVCKAYQEWYHNINPARVTLVFPAAYINNPSSMFGHTLLRIDPPTSKGGTSLTSYSISYAAETTEFNGLVFAIKGLTGGYQGFFSIQPYYDKVNEYSDLENRDIWEYELNFTPAEIQRLMEHAWELHKTAFDYYFLDENCSFQLLALLDVARPGMDLTGKFPLQVIPVDTIRAVLQQKNLLAGLNYRPASRTNLSFWLNHLAQPQQNWILEYSESTATLQDPRLTSLSVRDQAEVLDVAYEYVQFQYRRRILPRALSAQMSLALLTRRSSLSDSQPLPNAPQPATRPDQGHLSSRILLSYGALAGDHFAQFTWRPAYHDLLDDDRGHVAGAQINFLDVVLRKYTTKHNIDLERLTLIDIFSITPTSRFFHALSWHFDTGFERLAIDPDPTVRDLAYTVSGGAGYTIAPSVNFRFYGMLDASAIIHHDYTNSLAMGAGLRGGLLWQITPWWKLHLEAKALDISYHADRVLQSVQLGQSFVLNRNNALRLLWQRSGEKDHLATEVSFNWNHYY
jgi:hypothetical protein